MKLVQLLENLPIMLVLCLMFLHASYAQNYAGVIGTSLMCMQLVVTHDIMRKQTILLL